MLADPTGPFLNIEWHCLASDLQIVFGIQRCGGKNVQFVEIPGREIDLLTPNNLQKNKYFREEVLSSMERIV